MHRDTTYAATDTLDTPILRVFDESCRLPVHNALDVRVGQPNLAAPSNFSRACR